MTVPRRLTLRVDEKGNARDPLIDGFPVLGVYEVLVRQKAHGPAEAVLHITVGGVEFEGPATVDLRSDDPGAKPPTIEQMESGK